MVVVTFLIGIALCQASIGNFAWEVSRLKKFITYLTEQVEDIPPVNDTETPKAIEALTRYHPKLPPNLGPIPTDILPDNIPYPEDSSRVASGESPVYFPQRGQEFDRFGRLNPVFVPFSIPDLQAPTYYPFDRRTLRLAVPYFKIAVAFEEGNAEGRNLPVYLALQDDRFRIVQAPHMAIPERQDQNDTRFPIFRHFQIVNDNEDSHWRSELQSFFFFFFFFLKVSLLRK